MTSLYGRTAIEEARQLKEDLAGLAVASLEQAFAAPKGFYVYCLWGDDSERPLYIGKSANVFNRLGWHANRGTGNGLVWDTSHKGEREFGERTLVTRVTLLKCDSREVMEHVEVELIARFRPFHNGAQKPRSGKSAYGIPNWDLPELPPPPEAPPVEAHD